MKVVLLGTGNLAQALGRAMLRANVQIAGVWGRHAEKASDLAFKLGAKPFADIRTLPSNADVYILAVSDKAVQPVSESLTNVHGLVAHVSGSLPAEVLLRHPRHGVFYPLQTFSHNREPDFSSIPIFVQSASPFDLDLLKKLARLLGAQSFDCTDATRQQLHLAAVFACNFVNALYGISHELLKHQNLDFRLLHPLIIETAQKAIELNPYDAQTGPARRGDADVIDNHLKMLEKHPAEKKVYQILTEYILKKYHHKPL